MKIVYYINVITKSNVTKSMLHCIYLVFSILISFGDRTVHFIFLIKGQYK